LIVIHAALLPAVQVQPVDASTVTVPVVAPEPTEADAGEIDGVHDMPACVTVNVEPAIVSVPVRLDVLPFAAMLNVTAPGPSPEAPPVTVIHDTLLTAVQGHPTPALTLVPPVPPAAAID
jgi:hypothetical protein